MGVVGRRAHVVPLAQRNVAADAAVEVEGERDVWTSVPSSRRHLCSYTVAFRNTCGAEPPDKTCFSLIRSKAAATTVDVTRKMMKYIRRRVNK